MGGSNVKAVYGLWADLPDAAIRLLAFMAAIALDEDDPPRFYGGREAMAYALGWFVADKRTTDPAEIKKREQAFKSVNRIVTTLKRAGAITTLVEAAPGRTAEYALNLRVIRSPKKGDRSRPRSPKKGDHSESPAPPEPAPADGNGPDYLDGTVPSESTERSPLTRQTITSKWGPHEEKDQVMSRREEEMADLSTTSHPPRATADPDSTPTPESPPKCSHPIKIKGPPRADGLPSCAFCRREQRTPPPDNVIDLSTRRTS